MSNHAGKPPAWLTTEYIQNFLRKSLEDPNLIVENASISPGSNVGDNYCCQILRITLDINQNGNKTKKSIIAKLKPKSSALKAFEEEDDAFDIHKTENDFVTEILPKVQKRLNDLGIKKSVGPKVIYADIENSIIFMEDLKAQGFVMTERNAFLGLNECLVVMDNLATLHATSYLLIRDDPAIATPFQKYFWKKDLGLLNKFVDYSVRGIKEGIEKVELTSSQKNKVLNLKNDIDRTGFALAEPQHDSYLKVLLHSDCWKSNMMFRYVNDKPQEVCMFDYQIVHYNCFANDLQYFMATSAEANVIINETDTLLQRYWESFNEIAPNVLTLEKVKEAFESRYYIGYLWFLVLRPFIVSETPPDIDDVVGGNIKACTVSDICLKEISQMIPFYEQKGIV